MRIPCAGRTQGSGIEVGEWMERCVSDLSACRRTSGHSHTKREGRRSHLAEHQRISSGPWRNCKAVVVKGSPPLATSGRSAGSGDPCAEEPRPMPSTWGWTRTWSTSSTDGARKPKGTPDRGPSLMSAWIQKRSFPPPSSVHCPCEPNGPVGLVGGIAGTTGGKSWGQHPRVCLWAQGLVTNIRGGVWVLNLALPAPRNGGEVCWSQDPSSERAFMDIS